MSSIQPNTISIRSPVKRSLEKCADCRLRKIRCTPETRDFAKGEHCDACKKTNRSCGPNVRVRRRPSSFTSPTATTPAANTLSVNESRTGSGLILERPFALPDAIEELSQSGTTTTYNNTTPTSSFNSIVASNACGIAFPQAVSQLNRMGMLIDLYAYSCRRVAAVAHMQDVWPLKQFNDFMAAIRFFTLVVGHHVLTAFRHVQQLQSQVSTRDRELLLRRLVDTGQHYLACDPSKDSGLNGISNFKEELSSVQDELVSIYLQHQEYAEANRLRIMLIQPYQWLSNFTIDMMSNLAQGLQQATALVFGDIDPHFRTILDPTSSLRITAGHLAILRDEQETEIDVAGYSTEPAVEITGRNTLHLAAERSDVVFLRWALGPTIRSASSLLDVRDTFGLTPLMIAAYVGCLDTFRYLVSKGANLHAQDNYHKSILCLASMAGHHHIVSDILGRGVKLQDCIQWCSPLHDAAAAGRTEVVRVLLKHKAEPRDERAEHGNVCASKVALKHDHKQLAEMLSKVEQSLEQQLPTTQIDPIGSQIRALKRRVDAMARSRSPDSPSVSVATPQHDRSKLALQKRHRGTINDRKGSSLTATSLPLFPPSSAHVILEEAEGSRFSTYGSDPTDLNSSFIAGPLLPEYNIVDEDDLFLLEPYP